MILSIGQVWLPSRAVTISRRISGFISPLNCLNEGDYKAGCDQILSGTQLYLISAVFVSSADLCGYFYFRDGSVCGDPDGTMFGLRKLEIDIG